MKSNRLYLRGIPLLFFITQSPVFLQLTLTPDTVLYDLQAQCLREGGVLYRDILEPNLPGVVWIHAAVHSLAGPGAISLRLFDLFVVLGIAGLLGHLVAFSLIDKASRKTAPVLVVSLLLLFYFSTSEWCHCQRDTWMLFPCLLALVLRTRECRRAARNSARQKNFASQRVVLLSCLVEGVLWATGFWLKPFVAVPALSVLMASRLILPSWQIWRLHVAAIVVGGILTGAVGILWMVKSGCWPYFIDMLTTWNSDYFQSGRSRWTLPRFVAHSQRFWPWILLHFPALMISVTSIYHSVAHRHQHGQSSRGILLAACYLGWIVQAFALQQLFDYIHVPGIMLAIAVCIRWAACQPIFSRRKSGQRTSRVQTLAGPAAIVFGLLALAVSPAVQWKRQQHWLTCVHACVGGVLAPEVKDDLALSPLPRWKELQPLIDKLRELQVTDRSLVAYNGNLIHLYPELDLHPATRFVYVDVLARCFPRRRGEMLAELQQHEIRYAVSDLFEDGWAEDPADGSLLPSRISERSTGLFFPYNQTPIFRSGGYVLFRISRPLGTLTSDYSPLASLVWLEIRDSLFRHERQ